MKTLTNIVKGAKVTALVGLMALLPSSGCVRELEDQVPVNSGLRVCEIQTTICTNDDKKYSVFETNGVITYIAEHDPWKIYSYDVGQGDHDTPRGREFEAVKRKLAPIIRGYFKKYPVR